MLLKRTWPVTEVGLWSVVPTGSWILATLSNTVNSLPTVNVPDAAPMFSVVAAPNALIVVATSLNKFTERFSVDTLVDCPLIPFITISLDNNFILLSDVKDFSNALKALASYK